MKYLILIFVTLIISSCGNSDKKQKIDGNIQRDILSEVLTLSFDANKLTQPPNGESIFTLSEDIENEIISKLQRSIELGKTLDPKFLEFLEKDLPQQFSNNLIGGMEKYLQGFQSENATLQLEGNNLNMAWNQYWQRNKEVILDKMYPNN